MNISPLQAHTAISIIGNRNWKIAGPLSAFSAMALHSWRGSLNQFSVFIVLEELFANNMVIESKKRHLDNIAPIVIRLLTLGKLGG